MLKPHVTNTKPQTTSLGLAKLARPGDWTKNVFVFPALLASGHATEPSAILLSVIAFLAFSCIASGVYCINDSLDWEDDAKHPVKRHRPIPSGTVTPRSAMIAGGTWIVLGFLVSLLTQFWGLAAVLGTYLLVQIAYNALLKRIAFLDVATLSVGFVLRAFAGAIAIRVEPSPWLLACVFFFCLFLAQVKRQCDLSSDAAQNVDDKIDTEAQSTQFEHEEVRDDEIASGETGSGGEWHSAAGYRSTNDLQWASAVSAMLAIVAFALYSLSAHAVEAAGPGVRGFVLMIPLVIIPMYRAYDASIRGVSDSPLEIARRDPVIVCCTICFAVGAYICLYVTPVTDALHALFGIAFAL